MKKLWHRITGKKSFVVKFESVVELGRVKESSPKTYEQCLLFTRVWPGVCEILFKP